MKTIAFILLLICTTFFLVGCGNDMVIKGKQYKTIGLVNILVDDDSVIEPKYPHIKYRTEMNK